MLYKNIAKNIVNSHIFINVKFNKFAFKCINLLFTLIPKGFTLRI